MILLDWLFVAFVAAAAAFLLVYGYLIGRDDRDL